MLLALPWAAWTPPRVLAGTELANRENLAILLGVWMQFWIRETAHRTIRVKYALQVSQKAALLPPSRLMRTTSRSRVPHLEVYSNVSSALSACKMKAITYSSSERRARTREPTSMSIPWSCGAYTLLMVLVLTRRPPMSSSLMCSHQRRRIPLLALLWLLLWTLDLLSLRAVSAKKGEFSFVTQY